MVDSLSDPLPTVAVTMEPVLPGLRRRHGFFAPHETNSSQEPDDFFNSSSQLDITSESHTDSDGSKVNTPVELGNDNRSVVPGGVGSVFCKRFLKINWILFTTLVSMTTLLLLFLLMLCLLNEYVIYHVGLVPSRFYKVLGEKDFDGFLTTTAISFGIIVAVALIKSLKDYVAKLLTVNWRQSLCLSLHKMYFTRIYYYQLNVLDKVVDNPDQRVTQDVDKFTFLYGDMLPKFIVAPFVIGYYAYQAFSNAGWYGPVGCFFFFLFGSLVNRFAMLSIVKLTVLQEKCEGDFRFIHMLIRVHSESIAFQDGARREKCKADESLNNLISTQNRLYFRQFILNICINLYDYLGSILSYLILAIPIFAGTYDNLSPTDLSAVISQNSFVNMYLIYQFSQIVDLSSKIAELIGLTHRISQMIERLGEFNAIWKDLFPFDGEDEARADFSRFESHRRCGDSITLDELVPAWDLYHVSYSPPFRDSPLVEDLSLRINVGQPLLIVGSSSAGKSSMLRILRGLWPPTKGRVIRHHPPGPSGVFYCPQKPYLAIATLREQICFPLKPSCDSNQRRADSMLILNYMKLLNLMHVLDRVGGVDANVSWSVYETLSPGEIQRFCFIRVFFHRPIIAILDEATSALPSSMEDLLYRECQRLGITTISVAHRDSVRMFHKILLELETNGKWKLTEI